VISNAFHSPMSRSAFALGVLAVEERGEAGRGLRRGGGAAHGERRGEGEERNTTKGSDHGNRLLVDPAA
jgi:hypothetical protein